ncbi:hypothetical protein AGMMS49936_07100 [Endomicrobiia bacterium]|nr:hypothetical protein AGMMS49936_07100 [Endomicrobiia bacterium]
MKKSLLVFCSFFALSIFVPAIAQATNAPVGVAQATNAPTETYERSGIHFHMGNVSKQSEGCVLVPDRSDKDKIKESILKDKAKKEKKYW